jgi:hypothetical protein
MEEAAKRTHMVPPRQVVAALARAAMHAWLGATSLSGIALAQAPAAGSGCVPAAHTFCVVNTGDNSGTNPAVGAGTGTLRQAMVDANAAGGANTIGFAIPTNPLSPTPQTITLAAALPTLNPVDFGGTLTGLTIDGYSQPGSVLNTNTPDQGGLTTKLMIEIVGFGNDRRGFAYICCANPFITVTLQGLNLHGFSPPILGSSKAQWNVYGCFVGTNITGTVAAPETAQQGILIESDSAQIGGAQLWQRNLISGNGSAGVAGGAPNATVIIEGNLIGTDVSGTQAIPNSWPGVNLGGNLPNTRVGCSGAGCTATGHPSRNVISGNSNFGIEISGYPGATGLQITGNYIGTDWTGTRPLPNGTAIGGLYGCPGFCGGIGISNPYTAPAAIIGGFNPGEANLIAYNGGPGILSLDGYLDESFDNHGNAIHNNAPTDIAFFGGGWTPNDPGDADTGANNRQNYPVIQSAHVTNGQLSVTYSVDSATTNSTYPLRIDFYVDIDEGSGEFLGSDTYMSANAQAARTVTLTLPANALPLVGFVTTATDANGYSSEFSPSVVFDRIFADRFEGH